MVDDLTDPRRTEPPKVLAERAMLEQWLEFHRTTLLLKVEGLDGDHAARRPVPTSKLSLHGLVRHMGEVERNWFARTLLRRREIPYIWADDAINDRELELGGADLAADIATWQEECARGRAAARRCRCAGSTCT